MATSNELPFLRLVLRSVKIQGTQYVKIWLYTVDGNTWCTKTVSANKSN